MVNKLNSTRRWGYYLMLVIILAILFFVPQIVKTPYYLHLIIMTLIWVVMISGLNILQGYAGYVSLCQISFYGIGAYTSSLLMNKLGLPFIVCFIGAVLLGLIVGFLIGLPTLRTKGHYFSIASLAFCMLTFIVFKNWIGLTGGEHGYAVKPLEGNIFGYDLSTKEGYYYLVLIFALLTILFVKRLFASKTGRAIVTLRENENLAKAIGINTVYTKRLAFVLSAVLGSIGGVLYAHYMNYVNPSTFASNETMNAILAAMVGGCGTVLGPVLGSIVVIFLPEVLRMAAIYRQLIFGALLIIIVFVLPNGILPPLTSLLKMIGRKVSKTFRKSNTAELSGNEIAEESEN